MLKQAKLTPISLVLGAFFHNGSRWSGESETYQLLNLPPELSWFTHDVFANNTSSYDPATYRPTGKAYYIAPNGVDTNSGLTPASPKKTVANAAAVADCVIVYAAPGDYENAFWGDVSFQSNFRGVICTGPGRARFHAGLLNSASNFVADAANPGAYKWASGVANTIYDCRDEAWPTKYGTWGWMTKATSAAQVASTPGSWYSNGNDLWVRLRGDRVPDARLHVFRQRRCYIGKSNLSLYWEGIDWIGGNVMPNAAGVGIVNHLYNCDIAYPSGADDGGLLSNGANAGFVTYAKNVKLYGGRLDLLSLQGSAKGVYIDCDGFDCPIPGSNNANTMHGTASALLVGGRYYGTSGDVVISVSTGTVGCVGVMSRDCPGASGSDFSSTAGPMWLINCTNLGSISDWTAEGNGAKFGQNNALEPRVINATITPVTAYTGPGLIPQVPASPSVSGAVTLPGMTAAVPVVVTAAQLMAGASDALFVIDVSATGATVAGDGYGPWTLTPTSAGPVTLNYTVCGAMGRTVAQTATGTALAE